ncbi:hypothetical protein FB559_6996 [Actinoallomurus bryophytorum]|uniref:Uncharacterized protein n=1 Tax=Actinoallomurus bryophytorum TaxID=1490222 RepID=A0A543CVV5_9ACTN|nr:hypothetical protein FB559_6996 [Actinoallomurus bryophytorum]
MLSLPCMATSAQVIGTRLARPAYGLTACETGAH